MKLNGSIAAAMVVATLSLVGCAAPIKRSIEPEARQVAGGREVRVISQQAEIRADINVSNLTAAAGGGLLFALIDAGVNKSRAGKAEEAIKPLRDALLGFDFDGLMVQQTRQTSAKIDWLTAKEPAFNKELTQESQLQWLDSAATSQVLFADYDYATSPTFDAISVVLSVSLAAKELPPAKSGKARKPAERLYGPNLLYSQTFRSVIMLSEPSKEPEQNVQRWASDNGRLARTALETALSRTQWMLERGLQQSPEAAAALTKGKITKAGNFSGALIETTDVGTLLLIPLNQSWVLVDSVAL